MAEEEKEKNQEEKNQEELAKEWEEALKAQEAAKEAEEETDSASESEEDIMAVWNQALQEQEKASSQEEKREEEVKTDSKLELIRDIPLEVTIEIGNASIPLEEILKLHPNSIIELDRYIHEPVDIKINGKLIAKGQLYTVNENYAIKIVQIITPEERMKLIEEE